MSGFEREPNSPVFSVLLHLRLRFALRGSREGSSKCDHLQHVVVHDVAEKADNCGIFYSIFDFGSKPPSSRTIRHEVVTGGCGRCSHSPFVVTETRGPFCAFAHRFSCGSLTRGPLR